MINCDECGGECCKILVIEVETPESKDDFEDIKWYLYHPGVKVYIDVYNHWNVQFDTKCKYLSDDNKCLIYNKRPPVCRQAEVKDCHKNKKEIKKFFNSVEEFEAYLKSISPSK